MHLKMILLCPLLLLSAKALSQDTKVPQLYWVVETNIHHQNYTIVRFYNLENVKVHEVKIMGVQIDVRFPKQKRILDQLVNEYMERAIPSGKTKTEHYIYLSEKISRSLVTKRQF
jgi:hypothetical protein